MKKNILNAIVKDKMYFFYEYYSFLTKEDKFIKDIDEYMFMFLDKLQTYNNKTIFKRINEDTKKYNMSIIVTEKNTKNSIAIIDICFEIKQTLERSNNNFFVRIYYHKQKREFYLYNEKSTTYVKFRRKYITSKLFKSEFFYLPDKLENILKECLNGNVIDFSTYAKLEYKNALIHSESRFIMSREDYYQRHYKITKNSELNNLLRLIPSAILKDNILLYKYFCSKGDYGDYMWNNNVFSNHSLSLPFYKLEYLKIRAKDNIVDVGWINREWTDAPLTSNVKKGDIYIPEIGNFKVKRNQYEIYIKDNQLLRGLEWKR